jgi:hypothetical protein
MSATPPSPDAKIDEILYTFSNAVEHIVPEQALADAHECREAITPHLVQAVTQAHALSAAGRLQAEGDWRLPCFALHLLAAWRVPGTYDLILKSLMLADRYDSRWLMSDAFDDWPHLLLTTFDGDVDRLLDIVSQEDPPWNSDLRQCCLSVLSGAHHHGLGDRAAIEAGFERVLDTCCDDLIVDSVMFHIAELKLMKLVPKVWQTLESRPEESPFGRLDVEGALESEWTVDFTDLNAGPNPITRPREELLDLIRSWHYFQAPLNYSRRDPMLRVLWEHERAVNDFSCRPGAFILPKRTLPCDCGSGLPYGACCVRK